MEGYGNNNLKIVWANNLLLLFTLDKNQFKHLMLTKLFIIIFILILTANEYKTCLSYYRR